MDNTTILQWIVNGLSVATFIGVSIGLMKFSRWTGIVDTRITNLEGWMQSHIEHYHDS